MNRTHTMVLVAALEVCAPIRAKTPDDALGAKFAEALVPAKQTSKKLLSSPKPLSSRLAGAELAKVEELAKVIRDGAFYPVAREGQEQARTAVDGLVSIFETTRSEAVQLRILDSLLMDSDTHWMNSYS